MFFDKIVRSDQLSLCVFAVGSGGGGAGVVVVVVVVAVFCVIKTDSP